MSEPQYAGGGFGDASGIRSQMSEQLQRRLAVEDAREAQEAAKEARRQEQIAASYQERAIAAAIQEAHARGEMVSVHEAYRTNGASLGHTVGEFIAQRHALMELEDAQQEAREAAEFRRWKLERSADMSRDSSAPTPAEAEMSARIEHHALAFETRQIERDRKAAERKAADARMLALARSVVRYG